MGILFRELAREKAWSRIHLVPLLLAEGDRDTYRREQAALEREKEIMKDVKGWEVRIRSPDLQSESLIDRYALSPPASLPVFSRYTIDLIPVRLARVSTTMRATRALTPLWSYDSSF